MDKEVCVGSIEETWLGRLDGVESKGVGGRSEVEERGWAEEWHGFFLVVRRPPRYTQSRSSAASDVYKGQA